MPFSVRRSSPILRTEAEPRAPSGAANTRHERDGRQGPTCLNWESQPELGQRVGEAGRRRQDAGRGFLREPRAAAATATVPPEGCVSDVPDGQSRQPVVAEPHPQVSALLPLAAQTPNPCGLSSTDLWRTRKRDVFVDLTHTCHSARARAYRRCIRERTKRAFSGTSQCASCVRLADGLLGW